METHRGATEWHVLQLSLSVWSTVIPGAGTIAGLLNNPFITVPSGGCIVNDRGQVLFSAVLTDGTTALLLASPG